MLRSIEMDHIIITCKAAFRNQNPLGHAPNQFSYKVLKVLWDHPRKFGMLNASPKKTCHWRKRCATDSPFCQHIGHNCGERVMWGFLLWTLSKVFPQATYQKIVQIFEGAIDFHFKLCGNLTLWLSSFISILKNEATENTSSFITVSLHLS